MRTSPLVALCGFLLAGTLPLSDSQASCGSSLPMSHLYGGYIQCLDVPTPVAFAYAFDDPSGTNTGAVPIVCAAADGGLCPVQSGVAGDNRVTIESDWQAPGMIGCPDTPSGRQRVVIVLATGNRVGGTGTIVSLSGADPYFRYALEAAHLSGPTGSILPLAIDGTVSIVQVTVGMMSLHFSPPQVHSDCDPGTLGENVAACIDGFRPAVSIGEVYTRLQPCGDPVDIRRAGWTATGVTPAATGAASLLLPPPPAGRPRPAR